MEIDGSICEPTQGLKKLLVEVLMPTAVGNCWNVIAIHHPASDVEYTLYRCAPRSTRQLSETKKRNITDRCSQTFRNVAKYEQNVGRKRGGR